MRIVGELLDWTGHSPDQLTDMRDALAGPKRRGIAVIYEYDLAGLGRADIPE